MEETTAAMRSAGLLTAPSGTGGAGMVVASALLTSCAPRRASRRLRCDLASGVGVGVAVGVGVGVAVGVGVGVGVAAGVGLVTGVGVGVASCERTPTGCPSVPSRPAAAASEPGKKLPLG